MTSKELKQQLHDILPPLRRFAISLCGSVSDADDLVQSTVERLLTRTMPDDVELIAWAFKVCRNIWIDDYRARKVREKATQHVELQRTQSADNEERVTHAMQLDEVNQALAQLPDDQRSMIALVAVQGLSYREVAGILGVPTGTVMSRLARARSKLAEYFEGVSVCS
ncbi:MAG: RNA polymerase sigma factor [Gammaproteobacteria bacterium]|jgi:RNA polymerase sigma-70 factor (ECF subfamily)|nr:RNA polymerase sigma factor [Gammaproteobacteria bacterium]